MLVDPVFETGTLLKTADADEKRVNGDTAHTIRNQYHACMGRAATSLCVHQDDGFALFAMSAKCMGRSTEACSTLGKRKL